MTNTKYYDIMYLQLRHEQQIHTTTYQIGMKIYNVPCLYECNRLISELCVVSNLSFGIDQSQNPYEDCGESLKTLTATNILTDKTPFVGSNPTSPTSR